MNHPKGFTVDDKGNIYVADAMNMAIRKISDTGKLRCPGGRVRCTWFCLFLEYPMPFGVCWSCPACLQHLDPKLRTRSH